MPDRQSCAGYSDDLFQRLGAGATSEPRCRDCGTPLTDENWAPSKRCHRDYLCRRCNSRRAVAWDQKNPEKRHARGLRHRFGITVEQYNSILASQNGGCAICGESCSTGKRLAVDHNHETGEVRGLLCAACNRGLGMLKDSPRILASALNYLVKHKLAFEFPEALTEEAA